MSTFHEVPSSNNLKTKQETLQAQTQWFHMFKAMVDTGELAKLSGSAVKVYLVIKAHTNYSTGLSFPAIETIALKSGISIAQVKRELKVLENCSYIIKSKKGRCNVYKLREKVEITDDSGKPSAVATWDYLPKGVKEAVADLKNVLLTGEFSDAKIVHIESLQVNVTHLHDQAINFNVHQMISDLEKLPLAMRKQLASAFEASNRRKQQDPDTKLYTAHV